MTTAIFSTIDRLTSRCNPIDRLITTVAARLLPQCEASAYSCPPDHPIVDITCWGYCSPTADIRYAGMLNCCDGFVCNPMGIVCCDCCG